MPSSVEIRRTPIGSSPSRTPNTASDERRACMTTSMSLITMGGSPPAGQGSRGSSRSPPLARERDDELELGALGLRRDLVAERVGREAALRRERQPLER